MTWQEQTNWKHRIRFSSEMNDRHLHDDLCTEIRIARFSGNIMVVIKGAMSSIWVIGISGPSSREGKGIRFKQQQNKKKQQIFRQTIGIGYSCTVHFTFFPPLKINVDPLKIGKGKRGCAQNVKFRWKTQRDLYFVLHNLRRDWSLKSINVDNTVE